MLGIKEWLSNYDAGKEVETVEMGGLGDGYEVPIQHLAIEVIREISENEIPNDISQEVNRIAHDVATRLDDLHGFSGAQVGAAKNIAAVFLKNGIDKGLQMMRDREPERIIKIKKGINKPFIVRG